MYCSLSTPLMVYHHRSFVDSAENDKDTLSSFKKNKSEINENTTSRTLQDITMEVTNSMSRNTIKTNNVSKSDSSTKMVFISMSPYQSHRQLQSHSSSQSSSAKKKKSVKISSLSQEVGSTPSSLQKKGKVSSIQRSRLSFNSSSASKSSSQASRAGNLTVKKTFFDFAEGIYGCKHYQRSCQILSPCCQGKFYTCRFCHDEANPLHKLDPKKVELIGCMKCGTVQTVKQDCEKCGERFGDYFCEVCRMFSSDPTKSIYHCVDCGICRIGKGLGIDVFHCKKCATCMDMSLKNSHKCVERSLESNCPICTDFLQNSSEPITFLDCGHSMHTTCFDQYSKTSYTCPICLKSMGDMTEFFQSIDHLLQTTSKPSDTKKSIILCNDCEKKSCVPSHLIYHKCAECKSYNTKVLHQFYSSASMASSSG